MYVAMLFILLNIKGDKFNLYKTIISQISSLVHGIYSPADTRTAGSSQLKNTQHDQIK